MSSAARSRSNIDSKTKTAAFAVYGLQGCRFVFVLEQIVLLTPHGLGACTTVLKPLSRSYNWAAPVGRLDRPVGATAFDPSRPVDSTRHIRPLLTVERTFAWRMLSGSRAQETW